MSVSGGRPEFIIEVEVPPLHRVLEELNKRTLNSTSFERSKKPTSDKCTIFFESLSFSTKASVHFTDHEGADETPEILSAKFNVITRSRIPLDRDSKITRAILSSAIRTTGNQGEVTEISSSKWPATIQYKFTTKEELEEIEDIPHTFPYDPESTKIKLGLKNLNLRLYDDKNNARLHGSHKATIVEGEITIGTEHEGEIDSVKRSLIDRLEKRFSKKGCNMM